MWVVGTAIALSTGIGVFSLFNSRASEYRAIDSKVSIVLHDVMMSEAEPLTAALYSIESHKYDFALILTPVDALPIEILSTSDGYSKKGPFRRHEITLGNGDVITVAASTLDIDKGFRQNSIQLAGFIMILNLFYILLGIYYVRGVSRKEDQIALAKMQSFIGDASHELRTPLTVVKGYSEMLSADQFTDPEMKQRAFQRVNGEIKRMENIISDLLLLAELGEMRKPNFDDVDLSEITRSHVDDFQTLQPQRKVETSIEEVTIKGDAEHLHRLFSNSLANIARHTPQDAPVRITLSGGEKKKLLIEDGGPGLPDGMYGEVITHFQRFDKSRSRDKGGSGLGMSIMQAIVAEHHGSFRIRKSDLGGVALEILLP